MVDLSANEAASLTKLAARGAGYPWGLCEEAVVAARWLCSCELSGSQALVLLCQQVDRQPLSRFTPHMDGAIWTSADSSLCPLICGSALCDRATLLTGLFHIVIKNLISPILLLPFVSQLSVQSGLPVQIAWNELVLMVDAERMYANRDVKEFDQSCSLNVVPTTVELSVHIAPSASLVEWSMNIDSRQTLSPACLQELQKLAQRTYAPNTEQSRLQGAGAGNSDNE